MNKQEVANALRGLDPRVKAHWTKAGIPALDHLESVLGYGVTRAKLKEMGFANVDRESAPIPDGPEAHTMAANEQIAEAVADDGAPDAIALIEAFCAAVQADSFRRNGELQALSRQWQVQQNAARTLQDRLDRRNGLGKYAETGDDE